MMSVQKACLAAIVVVAVLFAGVVDARTQYFGNNVHPRFANVLTSAGLPGVTRMGNAFNGQLLNAENYVNRTIPAGQEVRYLVVSAYLANVTKNRGARSNTGGVKPFDGLHAGYSLSGLLRLGNFSLLPAYNISGPSPVRIRVIAAFASRLSRDQYRTETPVSCTRGQNHDVWFEVWGMSPRNLAWGRHMVFSSFTTFTAPPFHFRLCIKDVTRRNGTASGDIADLGLNRGWMEFANSVRVYRWSRPLYLWRTSGTNNEAGDFAAIEITTMWTGQRLFTGMNFNVSRFSVGDTIKLVPFGYPCTFEKTSARPDQSVTMSTSRTDQYCGSNVVHPATGMWRQASTCPSEGSFAGGLARTASRSQNPFAQNAPASWITSVATDLDTLVGYLQLPSAGAYDVCVSTREYRRQDYNFSLGKYKDTYRGNTYQTYIRNAIPVWFKAYSAAASGCAAVNKLSGWVASCDSRSSALVVANVSGSVTFATKDETPSSWGEMAFTSTGPTLSYSAATSWDHSAIRNFFNLTGGDMVRLVPEGMFLGAAPTGIAGGMLSTINIESTHTLRTTTISSVAAFTTTFTGAALSTTNEGGTVMYGLPTPPVGTAPSLTSGAGCWWMGNDNYGAASLNGNPSTQCCSSPPCTTSNFCSLTDTGSTSGVTASANLGGNPRIGYSPWNVDGSGSNSWLYLRYPPNGRYRVCYRRAGSNWRVLAGTTSTRTTTNVTLLITPKTRGYTYHFNDSRAETWGPVAITSLSGATLNTLPWTFYTSTATTVAGSALKIVTTADSCYTTTAQSRSFTMDPGTLEALGSTGSGDDSSTAASTIYFYVRIPSFSTTTRYRICFRKGLDNWQALSDPKFSAHLYMTTANEFGPRLSSGLSFLTPLPARQGAWARFVFNRTTASTPSFNAASDWVRLVPNATAGNILVNCDMPFNPTSPSAQFAAQQYSGATFTARTGVACAVGSSVSTDTCYTNNLAPTADGINGNYPYSDIVIDSNVTGVSALDGSIAFLQLPSVFYSGRVVSYRVCYKQARFANWIEAQGIGAGATLSITSPRTISFSTASTVYTGQYTYIALSASAATPITWSTDLLKLVPSTSTCDAPAAAHAGYVTYASLSGISNINCMVDGTNASQVLNSCGQSGTTTTARAYLTIPTASQRAFGVFAYRVCYMPRSSSSTASANWHDLSSTGNFILAQHQGIGYTVTSAPRAYGTLRIRFVSGGQSLDTRPSRDRAKVIPSTGLCMDLGSTDYPSAALFGTTHQGVEPNSTIYGTNNLDGSDAFPARTGDFVVVLNGSNYKVCYSAYGYPWVQVIQAQLQDRIYSLATTSSILTTTTSDVNWFTLSSAIAAQAGPTSTYNGLSWSSLVVGGVSTRWDSNAYFTVTYKTARATTSTDIVKLVQTHVESSPGNFVYVAGQHCFSDGRNVSITALATVTSIIVPMNMPLTAGRYLVCIYVTTLATWFQVPVDTTTNFMQPFHIISPRQTFQVLSATAATTFRVVDYNTVNGTNMGGLTGADQVYFINAAIEAGVCGNDASYNNAYRNDAASYANYSNGVVDTSSYLAIRDVNIGLPTATGVYMVCLKRTQSTTTNATNVAPFVQSGWYQLPNDGTLKGPGSNFFVNTVPTKLNISGCPIYNTTYKLRAGSSFDIMVTEQDASSNNLPFAIGTKRYAVSAQGTGYSLQNYGGDCSANDAPNYGYTSGALTQYLKNGKMVFSVTSLSACPTGGCTLSFTTPTLTASPVCRFDVMPSSLKTVRIASLPASCDMNTWCSIRVVAINSDDGVAYALNSAVQLLVAGASGLSVLARVTSTGGGFSVGAGGGTVFTNGILDAQIQFTASSFAQLAATTTVTVTASSGSFVSPAWTVSVVTPVASEVHIVDLYPVANTGAALLPLQPSWEPTYGDSSPNYFRGSTSGLLSSATLTAAPGYHLVAGQYYTVVLRVAGAKPGGTLQYLTSSALVDSSILVTMDNTAFVAAGNALIDGSCTSITCTTPVAGQSLAPVMTFTFRLLNTLGCPNSICTINFKFNGANLNLAAPSTRLVTPVRSIATKLSVKCATSASGLSSATSTCPSSTVNTGWYINATAVDDWGSIDAFFDGEVLAALSSSASPTSNAQLTTVAALTSGTATTGVVTIKAVAGVATFTGLTFTRPCVGTGCTVELLSPWGLGVTQLGSLQAVPNTVKLSCQLDKALAYCNVDVNGNCVSIAGVSAANATNANSLLYGDTVMCVNVFAVDFFGNPTLYETNWILYYAQDTATSGQQTLTVRDDNANTDFVRRYKAMTRSQARFCYSVSGTFTSAVSFKTTFVAQRFNAAGYWSQGSTGTCTVGPMKVWPTKMIASLAVTSATGLNVITSGSQAVLAGEKSGSSAVTVVIGFSLLDHYGAVIQASQLMTAEQSNTFAIRTAGGVVDVAMTGSKALRGGFNATVVSSSTTASGTLQYTLTLDNFCLGCSLGFTMRDSTSATLLRRTLTSPLVATAIVANASIYLVNTKSTTTRTIAFVAGTSPFGRYWINGTSNPLNTNTAPTSHVSACVASSCKPNPASFNLAQCDPRGLTYFGATNSTPLQMRVLVMEAGASLTSAFEPIETAGTSMLDILNSYTVTVSLGSQLLSCINGTGAPCSGEGTNQVSQTLAAFGTTTSAAVAAFAGVLDSAIPSTAFYMIGLTTSNFLKVNYTTSTISTSDTPSVSGEFKVNVTASSYSGTVQGIAYPSGNPFYWRPQAEPVNISILSVAADATSCGTAAANFSCYGGSLCNTAGVAQQNTVGALNFAYAAQTISIGVPFPITVEVWDITATRVRGAKGIMTLSVDSWTGCGNGGEISYSGAVVDGRATIWFTFAAACQACVLKAVYAPDASQSALHATMAANPGATIAYTLPINVVSTAPASTHMVASAATPSSILTAGSVTQGTIITPFTVQFAERGNVGRIPVNVAVNTATVTLYVASQSFRGNWWLLGNGGVLRSSLVSTATHRQVTATGSATSSMTFYFSRTCTSCSVIVEYQIPSLSVATFTLPTTFNIITAPTSKTLVGVATRAVPTFADAAFAIWSTGSEDSSIAVAGVASGVGAVPSPAASVAVTGNGDGGTMTSATWVYGTSVLHRVSFTSPCTQLAIASGGVTIPLKVYTTPTFLQPLITAVGGVLEPIVSTSVGQNQFISLRALDDSGYIGEMYGLATSSFPARSALFPLCCAVSVTPQVSADGITAGGFPRTESTFIMADVASISGGVGTAINGGVGTMNISFSQPVRNPYIIFTTSDGLLTSATTSLRAKFPQPRFAISVGKSGLTLRAVSNVDVTRLTSNIPFTVDVALVGNYGGDNTRFYVATGVSNNITVSFTSACPSVSSSTATLAPLVDGYVRFNITFTGSDTTGSCRITFTAQSGGGGSCSSCSATLSTVSIKALAATSFRFLRPSAIDNGIGSSAGLLFGSAGRTSKVTVQLYGSDAFGNSVPVTVCATCSLIVTMEGSATGQFSSCALNTDSPASFNTNGTATVSVLWQDNAQPTYLCNARVAVYSDSGRTQTLLAPDGVSPYVTTVVTICRPAKVVIATNTSAVFRGTLLNTGVAYNFYVTMLDANGNLCRGDSQDDATTLSIDAVANDPSRLKLSSIVALNVNMTDTTTTGFLNNFSKTVSATTSAQAVGGGFNFQLVLSNATSALGLSGVIIRVTARSATPAITGSSAVAYSSTLQSIVAATQLRFAPSATIPTYIVTNRVIQTSPTGYGTQVIVQAVDGLRQDWVSLGLIKSAPNIATSSTAYGNNAQVFWKVLPSTGQLTFPLTFGTGTQQMYLTNGQGVWDTVKWTGPNGVYSFSVAATNGGLTSTSSISVSCQQVTQLRYVLGDATLSSPSTCTTGCALPTAYFPLNTSATVNSGLPVATAQSLQPFVLNVVLRDDNSAIVIGDSESVIMMELIADPSTSLQMGVPPALTTRGATYARVKQGRAQFTMAFIGSTAVGGNVDILASFRFSCPAVRPAGWLYAGEPSANPCVGLSNVTTGTFAVVDVRLPLSAHSTPAALAARSVFKVKMSYNTYTLLNQSQFQTQTVVALSSSFGYITQANIASVMTLLPCTVTSSFNNDLGSSVCTGTVPKCSSVYGNTNCPPQVLSCGCPIQARSAMLSRYLLQTSTTNVTLGGATALEFSFNLANADAFPARNENELVWAYGNLTLAMLAALQGGNFSGFPITSISTRTLNAAVVTATVAATPVPSATPVGTPSPTTKAPVVGAATWHSSVLVLLASLAASLLALLA